MVSAVAVGGVGIAAAIMGLSMLAEVDNVKLFGLGGLGLTAIMAFLLLWRRGSQARLPAGSWAALISMAAGTFLLIANPFHSDDMPVYLTTFACMAAVLWESVDLLLMHNRECSNAMPQFETHQGGEDRA